MTTEQRTHELLAGHNERVETWASVEMATRDADAERYEDFFTDFQTRVELEAYAAHLKGSQSQRALEVGCGVGRTMGVLESRRRVGLNLSHGELLVARRRFGPDVLLVQASATAMPFKDGVFDTVLCAGVLHHIPGEGQRRKVVEEMARVGTADSRLVLALHGYSWVVRWMFPREMVYHNLFWHRYTVGELRALLRGVYGRSKIHIEGICHLPRWRVGDRLGRFGVWLDRLLSKIPGLAYLSGIILVARVDRRPAAGTG